jgi:peptidylprolyl isomerase
MSEAKKGDMVKVHYTGRFEDGSLFDSSKDRGPLQFTLGNGEMIPGFENAIIGMKIGDTKTAKIAANEAYGPYIDDMVMRIGKDKFPADMELKTGLMLKIRQPEGNAINVMVTDISDDEVVLDANHPLAGKDLEFDIELVHIG